LIRARVDNATKDSERISLGSQAGTTGSTRKETCTIPHHTSSPLSFPSTASRIIVSGPTWTRGLPGRSEDIQARSSIQASIICVVPATSVSSSGPANAIWLRTWHIMNLPDHHVRPDSGRPESSHQYIKHDAGPFRSNSQRTRLVHNQMLSSCRTSHPPREAVVIAPVDWPRFEAPQELYNRSTLESRPPSYGAGWTYMYGSDGDD
jgi:hypothetical protein